MLQPSPLQNGQEISNSALISVKGKKDGRKRIFVSSPNISLEKYNNVCLSGLLRDLWRESSSFAQGDEERITPETSLIGDLVADLLDVVEITMELEEAFDVEFGDDAVALTTVQQIVDYIQTKLDDQR